MDIDILGPPTIGRTWSLGAKGSTKSVLPYEQGCKKSRSLRSGILDNSYLVRQIRLDTGEARVLVRQIWPGRRPGFSFDICVCLNIKLHKANFV